MKPAREGLDCLDGRINVRRLGVVVVLHAANGSDVLQSVLDGFEFLHGAPDSTRLRLHQHANADRGQHVFKIVRALERNLAHRQNGQLAICVPPNDFLAADKRSTLNFTQTTEPVHAGLDLIRHRHTGRVIGIQYREIVGALIFEDASLGGRIIFKAVMPVEMVGRDVQDGRDLRMECVNRLELKAADFQHDPCLLGRGIDEADRRGSNVAAH